ncbi:Hpt domain-containing protein [Pseudoalteromonas sp. T1lg23B]|uniref:Hpt domain-containing protein n=1 Tax=Pseudoalteromonas sp. T1lg23B TaxID=2077097 RepID=UPI000CF6A790|nr:Hpt domain-containing protein [Pseudoalteromonas sp. T1lg23B]
MNVSIDNSALESMQSLLGEQFEETLIFCCSEFERLENDLKLALNSNRQEAIRHAHSLKSNAAQFGATSLSSTARAIEQGLMKGDDASVSENMALISEQVIGSKSQLLQWLSMNR